MRVRKYTHGARILKNEIEIMAKMVKITSYFTRSSETDECNNVEFLPEGDNQLLCGKELWQDNELLQNSDNELLQAIGASSTH